MRFSNVFLFEFNHFKRSRSKLITYLIFLFACIYSIYSGFDLQDKQFNTIDNIQLDQKKQVMQVSKFFQNLSIEPYAIDILGYIPTYGIKKPSPLFPLGIGQAEQYGYYKKITTWSSTYDNDMVEELANPERLVNGNIDFSFLVIFLLPILLIIFTYNIRGFEQDARFEKLIAIQCGSIRKWVFIRFLFYVLLLILTVIGFVIAVSIMNNAVIDYMGEISSLILLLSSYIVFFGLIFYLIILKSHGSSTIAFKMMSVWLLFCIIIPGSVHQIASMVYPVHYMTDYLDANRKETYEVFDLPNDSLYLKLLDVYPDLEQTQYAQNNSINQKFVRNAISAIVNDMNKRAISKIEDKNEEKNQFIRGSYWFNPVSFIQNKWNSYISTDYYAYRDYRIEIQAILDKKLELLNFEAWNDKTVSKLTYETYLKDLKVSLD